MTHLRHISIILVLFSVALFAQIQPAQPDFTRPTYILLGVARNQFTGMSAFASAIVPVGQGKMFASASTDFVPAKYVDENGRSGRVFGATLRIGTHREMWSDAAGKTHLLLGGDIGPSFSQSPSTSTVAIGSSNIGVSGSFTVTVVHMITDKIGIAIPIRALYMSKAGPGGAAAWNPVVELSILLKP